MVKCVVGLCKVDEMCRGHPFGHLGILNEGGGDEYASMHVHGGFVVLLACLVAKVAVRDVDTRNKLGWWTCVVGVNGKPWC
jgi:hypothetical protein